VNDPAFIGGDGKFGIYTRWIETEWENDIPAWNGISETPGDSAPRNNVVVEVNGKRIEVSLPAHLGGSAPTTTAGAAPKRKSHGTAGVAKSGKSVVADMQSSVVKIAVAEGDIVEIGQTIVVLEAMKMEQPIKAHKAGTIKNIKAEVGTTVPAGTVLMEIED
ncbi:MAG: acetyl-CoA carboxylase biotin carboxyl carrier protein subunit, partial [Micrococcales bacterium]